MPRKKFLPSSEFPYHITARCLNREWFAIPLDEVWCIFSDYLFFIHHAFGVRLNNFVLMNNHFHLILRTPEGNLDKVMNYFMRETSRVIARRAGRINQTYGGPYYWSLIKSPNYFLHAYKYVYRNPIEARLAKQVESYKYSTIHSLIGQQHSIIPLEYDDTLFSGVVEQLRWLNTPYPNADFQGDIRKALRRREFKFAKDKRGDPHPLEHIMV